MTRLIRRHSQTAIALGLLCALALALTGFSGSPQGLEVTFSGPTNVAASAADGTITVTWTPGNAAASQVIVVVNVVDDTDYCLEVDATGVANLYQCAGRTEGETYVALVIALDGEGGYALGQTTQRVPVTFTGPERDSDLVVDTPTLDGDGPTIGATFTLKTTVTNRGGRVSSATTLRYYQSTEPVISSADTAVGSEPVGGLAAAAASNHSIGLTAPREPRTYYYRACVDRASGEANSTNNCSGVLAVNVVGPDLTVSAPTVAGDNPLLGTTFTMAATVKNQGSSESAATTLRYYSSTDDTITTADTELGTDPVGILATDGTSDQSVDLTAPIADGTYYYGACVDAVSDESDTGNNCSGTLVITLGAPDLVVSKPTSSADGPTAGASFTLSATVRNQGSSATADATTLRYYRSTDATITSSDTELGTDTVSALAAFGSSDQSIELTAPSDAGTYYYGACADTVTGESSTTNNCSDSLAVTVVAPDLLVGTPTLSGDNPVVGASFTLQARVLNQGGAGSGATTVRFYRSDDATVTTSDTEVGTASVSSVAAEGVSSQLATLTAPSDSGDYHYGACVDTVSGEYDTTNNCSGALTVTVEAPDLTAGKPSVSGDDPAAGGSFTLTGTVSNRGGAEAVATTLRFYRSDDTTITTSDTEAGTKAVDALSGGYGRSYSIDLTAPSDAGTYYYGTCVDTVSSESDASNNCSDALTVTVAAPDLVVTTPTVDGDNPGMGASFTLKATVKNQGEGESAATTLRYYSSTDATITTSDTEVGTDSVGSLAADGTSNQSIDLTAPSTAGTYYYGACVDTVTGESDTNNNCSAALALTVGAPDLVVSTPTVSASNPEAGGFFTLSATVSNQGSTRSAASTLRYYRSTDTTITTSDTSLGTDSVGVLVAFGASDQSIDLTAPSDDGTYYYGACVDAVSGESSTTNNCSGAVTVTVGAETATAPDLVVISGRIVVSRIYLEAGATTQARVIVENQGDGASSATTARFYWSTDATINPSEDTEGGTVALVALAADATSDQLSFHVNNPNQPGLYYFGGCVDAVSGESDTTNNCQSSRHTRITVKGTDLTVWVWKGGVNRDYANLVVDRSFTLQARVSSNGLAGKATTVRYYRSTDATISTSDTELGTRSVPAIRAPSTSSSHSFSLTAPSTAGTYYYGACVDPIATESSTTNNCDALKVTVDATAAPDLTARVSRNGGNLLVDASFTLNAYVWNPGSAASGSTTLRYYRSTDSTITTSDTSLGTDSVDGLARGGNSAQSIDLTAPSEAGTYYYGACVGTVAGESVTTNNCSDALTVKVEAAAVPDLSVSAFVSTRGITVYDPIGISYSVRNQGSGSSDATTLRFYRSTDGTITTADTELDTASVSGLTTGASSSHQFETTLPRGDGTYYYGTCVDAVTDESDTTNNCSSSWSFTVSNGVFAD